MMNRKAGIVRKRTDRRVLRTRQALAGALVELMLERGFDDINVQQVLDRAGVARATFYTHFRSKHDLLLSDAERYLSALEQHFMAHAGESRRVAPVAELFGHVAEYHGFQRSLDRSGPRDTVYDLLTGHLARMIARRIAVVCPAPPPGALPPAATARVYAAALVEMLRWWLERTVRPDAQRMDDHFHELVRGGLDGTSPAAGYVDAPTAPRRTSSSERNPG